jgi:hypothetical protein
MTTLEMGLKKKFRYTQTAAVFSKFSAKIQQHDVRSIQLFKSLYFRKRL